MRHILNLDVAVISNIEKGKIDLMRKTSVTIIPILDLFSN